MVESDVTADVWAGLETAIEAFERGLDEYQTQFHAWSQDRRTLIAHETAMAKERTSASVRGLEEGARQLARDQESLAQDKAGLEQLKAELAALAAEYERRDRALCEREATQGQRFSSHDEIAATLQEREKQLDRQQCELQARFDKSQQDLEDRKNALAAAEKETAAQRRQLDRDHQELARSRDERTRREHELASQSAANDEARQKLAQLSAELDSRQRNLEGEDDGLATRRSQIDCRTAELSSLESQLQTRLAEIDARTLALDADSQRLKEQSDVLANRERELEQTAAKCAAEQKMAAHDLERRERELADATLALSARAEGLETVQCEIETRQQAAQAAAREHQQREQVLAETQRKLAERQAALEEAEGRLRATDQALKAEGGELETMRNSVEAELAAKREESDRKEAESLARREQVDRDQKSVEQLAQSLDRRSQELERISKSLAEREGELNGQQAKLEAALQSLRNDRTAVEKTRSVVTEVDESRWSELNKVRAELNAMRTENELARARERELEGSLGKVQAANARERQAAEDARAEAARLAEQLKDEKRTAAEQRAAIFAECLIAAGLRSDSQLAGGLKGPPSDGTDGEHEVLALLKDLETKSAESNAKSPDGATLLVQRQASHTAVATFWTDFKPAPSPVGPTPAVSAGTKTIVADTTATESPSTSFQEVAAQESPTVETLDTQASAMREAPAAAMAEVKAAKHDEPTEARSGLEAKAPSNARKRKAGIAPVQSTREMTEKPAVELVAKQPAAVSASIDLDPATANKLRMMRRLNPHKSDQELLANISAEDKNSAKVKQKKGWFALR